MELTKEIWTQSDYDEFAEYLKTLADEKYKKFSDSLMQTWDFLQPLSLM